MIILSLLVLTIIGSLITMNYYAEKQTDKKEHLIENKLMLVKYDLHLELDRGIEEGLSDIEDLNALLEPTKATFNMLKRWEVIHQINPDYPYPKSEIEEQDWMGINQFLYGKLDRSGAKEKMIYDSSGNIDMAIYHYIRNGHTDTENSIVKEAAKQIENDE